MQIRTMIGVLALTLAFPLCGEPVRAKQYEMSQRFSHPGMKIRSNKLANWYVLGEEVVFSSETKLPETDRVRRFLLFGPDAFRKGVQQERMALEER